MQFVWPRGCYSYVSFRSNNFQHTNETQFYLTAFYV